MDKIKHTILGAGGVISNAMLPMLLQEKADIRLCSRKETNVEGVEWVKTDVTDYNSILNAVKDSGIVYLLVGLKYDTEVWRENWQKIMTNTINACKESNAKLIFFDNVYMYGRVNGKMNEETAYNPSSKKGEIRAKVAQTLEDEYKRGNIHAMIARSADFYGPYALGSSIPYALVFKNLLENKSPQWMFNAKTHHTFTYSLDAAKALRILSADETAYNQNWHLPSRNPAPTGVEFIQMAAKEFGKDPKYSVLAKWMVSLAGIFNKTIKELVEMSYQNEYDYYFDSAKFENKYDYKPVSYEDGIKSTVEFLKKQH